MRKWHQWSGLIALILLGWEKPVAAREPLKLEEILHQRSRAKSAILPKGIPQDGSQGIASNGLKQENAPRQILFQVDGILADGDATLNDNSLYDEHTFQGQAGQTIKIILNSRDFDTYLLLFAPSDELIAENDDSSNSTNSEILVQLPEDGVYRVFANAYNFTGRGAYQLTVGVAGATEVQQAEAHRLFHEGQRQYNTGQYQEALVTLQAALALYQELENPQMEAVLLANLGSVYDTLNDYPRAINFQEQALAIAREIGSQAIEQVTLGNIGNAYYSLAKYSEALDYYQRSLTIAHEIGDRPSEASTLSYMGAVYFLLANYPEALDYYQRSLTIAQELGNPTIEATTLNYIGAVYDAWGQYPEALDYFQQSLNLTRELGDQVTEAATLNNIGSINRILGNYSVALNYFQQSLAIARVTGNQTFEATLLSNIAGVNESLGNYGEALDFYHQSLEIAREAGSRATEARTLTNIGVINRFLGNYSTALDYHQQSLSIAQEIGDRSTEVRALNDIGIVNRIIGNYPVALDYHQQSLSIAQEIGDREAELTALFSLISVSRFTEGYEAAIGYAERSLEIAQEVGDREAEFNALNNLGVVNFDLEDYAIALNLFERSLAISQEIGNARGESNALTNLGNVSSELGDYSSAIAYYQQGLALARELGDRLGEAISLNNLGDVLYEIGQAAEAENSLREAIDIVESLRTGLSDTQRIAIADAQSEIFASLEEGLIGQGQFAEALVATERGRAQAFALQLALRQGASLDESPTTYPDLTAIQRIAQERNLTLLSYSLQVDEALHIWIMQPTGEIVFQSLDASQSADLANAIDDFRDAVGAADRGGFELVAQAPQEGQLRQLHQLLIEPIAQWLPNDPEQQVVIVPQGELFLVPFAALQDADGTYLIENHTLTTAPSIQVLDLATNLAAQNNQPLFNDALVVGNPTMPEVPDISLASLPGAEFEAREIGELVGTTALIGNQATEARIKATLPTAQLIHLATHGLLDYGGSPFAIPGAIALTPGNGEDGLLTADEILDMDLQAQLAILSACDTGQGQITGDGVVGLSRSLITAGVPSVVVSLWSVPDAPTASLMTEFYRQLTQGQTKAQALRQAMLVTLQTHPNPIDWAAFTLLGEAN
jgi:CHAT domain-containing protein